MTQPLQIILLVALATLSGLELSGAQSAVLLAFIAAVWWRLDTAPRTWLPPVAFLIAAYGLGFALPILLPDGYPQLWSRVPAHALEFAMLWTARGFAAFALGYVLVERYGRRFVSRAPDTRGAPEAQRRYTAYVLTSIGWLALLSWVASAAWFGMSLVFIRGDGVDAATAAGSAQQLLTLLSFLRYPFFTGFVFLYYWRQTDRHLAFLCVGLLVVSIVEIIAIGSKGSIIQGIVAVLLALAFLPFRPNARQMAVGACALVAVYGSFAVITEYRSIMQDRRLAGHDVFDFAVQAQAFGGALIASLPWSEATAERRTEVSQEHVLGRFGSGIFSFANLMHATGRQPPYEHAWETLLVPVYSIVPRMWLPDKPEFFHSGRNAREYYGWTYGGVSVSLLGSLYFAWGYAGIVGGMALLGALLACLVTQVRARGLFWSHGVILLAVLMLPMLDVGSTFQAVVTNVVRVAALLWLLRVLYPLAPRLLRGNTRVTAPLRRRRVE